MKKTLIYHLYVGDDIETNVVYNIHKECLKRFKHIFSNVRVTISLDDLSNTELKNRGCQWVNDIFTEQEIEITYTKNTLYREALTFYNKVLNNFVDDKVFFIHSKGTTNFKNPNIKNGSVFYWICAMYFFNLSNHCNTIELLDNGTFTFSGALLMKPYEDSLNKYSPIYAGCSYWINLNVLHNCEKTNLIPICKCSDRYFAERFPGMVTNDYCEYGFTSTSNKFLYRANLYDGEVSNWEYVAELYGCRETFFEFVEYISNKVGYIPYNE